MARKNNRIASKNKDVKKKADVKVPSRNIIPRPRTKPGPQNQSPSAPFKESLSLDAKMASRDPGEIDDRAAKRQKTGAGTDWTFDVIGHSKHDTRDTATRTPEKEEEDTAAGSEPAEKRGTTSSDKEKETDDAGAGNKREEHHSDLATGITHKEHDAVREKTAKSNITHALDPEVQHLQDQYKFTTMSIISSSQAGQKLNNLIVHATEPDMMDDGTFSLAGVVVASAKGSVISKLISIAEKFMRATDGYGNTYHVYTALKGVKLDKKPKPKEGAKTIRGWKQQQTVIQATASKDKELGTTGEDQYASYDTDDEAPAFENMGRLQIMAQEQHPKKVHVVPQMTMYIARVPVPGLKALFTFVILSISFQIDRDESANPKYSEQTNAKAQVQ